MNKYIKDVNSIDQELVDWMSNFLHKTEKEILEHSGKKELSDKEKEILVFLASYTFKI